MLTPLKFADLQAFAAPQVGTPPMLDGAELRAQLEASGAIRAFRAEPPCFAVGVPLDDAGIRDAARAIFFREVRGSQVRLARVLEQADPRVADALRVLVARGGLPREAA